MNTTHLKTAFRAAVLRVATELAALAESAAALEAATPGTPEYEAAADAFDRADAAFDAACDLHTPKDEI